MYLMYMYIYPNGYNVHTNVYHPFFPIPVHVGISILDADISTDIVEPADLNRYVGCM